jgi:hypothetical protein
MWKIAGYISIILIMLMTGLPVKAQQGPLSNLKTLGVSLDLLGRDSTLPDSGRQMIRSIAKTYKGLVQKLKDSIDQARKTKKPDTVFVEKTQDLAKQPMDREKATPVAEKKDSSGKLLSKQQAMLVSLDSTKALIAAVRKDISKGGAVFLYPALLLIGVGGVGWGLYMAERRRRAEKQAEQPVVEVAKAAKPHLGVQEEVKPPLEVQEVVKPPLEAEEVVKRPLERQEAVSISPKGSFICELMMTAGPRKKFMNEDNADKDLGEDVCGCVIRGDKAGVWLLDGTSDQFCLRHPVTRKEYFSSRLLAQDIGDRLREAFESAGKDEYTLDRMMTEAIEVVKTDWVNALRALPEDERALLAENIRGNNRPECSSTLLSAVLALDGKASVYRSGDSKLLVFQRGENGGPQLIPSEASLTTKNPESNDRIFFRIVLDTADNLDIICNTPAYEVIYQERVGTLVAFSDGIGPVTAEVLKNEYGVNPAYVRRRIGSDTQGTADDKSICFVSITEC